MKRASYSQDDLELLVRVIKRQNSLAVVNRKQLKRRLLDLIYAVGIAHSHRKASIIFRDAAAADFSHSQLAKKFRAIARAKNPLDPEKCRGELRSSLDAVLRTKWSSFRRDPQKPKSLRGHSIASLGPSDIDDIRDAARTLAKFHQGFIHKGPNDRYAQATLLPEIADIFLDFAKLDWDRYRLGHSRESHFIQFAHRALRPFLPATKGSPSALYHRWDRLKQANSQAQRHSSVAVSMLSLP